MYFIKNYIKTFRATTGKTTGKGEDHYMGDLTLWIQG